eukprot:2221551-Amphidinium_carterae.1
MGGAQLGLQFRSLSGHPALHVASLSISSASFPSSTASSTALIRYEHSFSNRLSHASHNEIGTKMQSTARLELNAQFG